MTLHPNPEYQPIAVKAVIPRSLGTRSQRINPWIPADEPAATICKTEAGYQLKEAEIRPTWLNVEHYSKTVWEKAIFRQLIQLSKETICRCYEGEERPAEILRLIEVQIFKIAAPEIRGGFEPTRNIAHSAYREIEESARNRKCWRLRHTVFWSGYSILQSIDLSHARSRVLTSAAVFVGKRP